MLDDSRVRITHKNSLTEDQPLVRIGGLYVRVG